jgi:hypothetical protein
MSLETVGLDKEFPTGFWTLYYHPSREKRWSIDSFEKVATVKTAREVLSIFKELGDKIKAGMFFWMKGSIPPLWENFNNIRGGSYSIRGIGDNGIKVFKMYTLACMMDKSMVNAEDKVNGISISPKLHGFGSNQQVGYFIIKIWNRDCEKFHSKMNLQCIEEIVSYDDIMYTPHVEKKM